MVLMRSGSEDEMQFEFYKTCSVNPQAPSSSLLVTAKTDQMPDLSINRDSGPIYDDSRAESQQVMLNF